MPNSITYIGARAFWRCTSLTSFTIPDSVTQIGEWLLKGCTSLSTVYIGKSLTEISRQTFYGCSSLKSLVIPSTVKAIGDSAFSGSAIISIDLPSSITSIVYFAFQDCEHLRTVTINSTNIRIGEKAFAGCKELEEVYCYANSVPGLGSNVFLNSYINLSTLYVPETSVENYKAAGQWKEFGTIKAISKPSYDVIYNVDGLEYKRVSIEEGGSITLINDPTREGYTFSGWRDYPENLTMPDHDVTIVGTFVKNETPDIDTDISTLSNVIYINSLEANKGNNVEISVNLKNNTMDISAFSFNLILPEGFAVTKVSRGERVKVKDDDEEFIFSFNNSDKDGVRYVQCYTMQDAVLSGKDGEVAKITISLPSDVKAGNYPIIINHSEVAYSSTNEIHETVKSTLTIKDYIVGDANGDGIISITDVSTIASYLLGGSPAGFNANAADANKDGTVSITDVSTLASLLLGK